MNISTPWSRPTEGGQVIVIMALSLVALMAAVAVVIDGGNAFAQQRQTQNAVDAAAEAGATQIARMIVGVSITDAAVEAAVSQTATANGITSIESAEYTDRSGAVLGTVGAGTIPAGTQGVAVRGSREFSTYIAGVVGMPTWTAGAEATAITGYR